MAREFDYRNTRGKKLRYPGLRLPPAIHIPQARVMGFVIFLGDPEFNISMEEYSNSAYGRDRLGLLDVIYAWIVYGDGLLWCPTYASFLEAVIEITNNWLENERRFVYHDQAIMNVFNEDPHALLTPEAVRPKEPKSMSAITETPPDHQVAFASNDSLPLLLNESTFQRIKAAHAARIPGLSKP